MATYITASIDGGNTFNAQTYANPQETATDAITGQTVVLGPEADNDSSGDGNRDATYGYGTQMGLAVYDGQVYPIWAGNFNQGAVVNSAVAGSAAVDRVPADGHRGGAAGRRQHHGPDPATAAAERHGSSFTVIFDRPINPPGAAATFTPADVQVFYHDTTSGDASIPLTSRASRRSPPAASGPAASSATPSSRSPSTPQPGGGLSGIATTPAPTAT